MQAAKRALTLEEVIPGVVLLATLATTITLAIPIFRSGLPQYTALRVYARPLLAFIGFLGFSIRSKSSKAKNRTANLAQEFDRCNVGTSRETTS